MRQIDIDAVNPSYHIVATEKVSLTKYALVNLNVLCQTYTAFKINGDVVVNVGEIDDLHFRARSVRNPDAEQAVAYAAAWGNYDSLERALEVVREVRAKIPAINKQMIFHQEEAKRLGALGRMIYMDILKENAS